MVQVSPSVKPSSSTTVPHTTTGSPSPSLKSLSISVRVAHDPISRGSTQTVFVKVSDNGNSSKPISGSNVDGKIIYASSSDSNSFQRATDNKGEMIHFLGKLVDTLILVHFM